MTGVTREAIAILAVGGVPELSSATAAPDDPTPIYDRVVTWADRRAFGLELIRLAVTA